MKGYRLVCIGWFGVALLLFGGLAGGQPPPEKTEVTGTVTDRQTGRPLGGAQVNLYRLAGEEEPVAQHQYQTATDERGQFHLSEVEEGTYSLAVSASDHVSQSQQIQVTPQPVHVEIALDRFSLITGRVLDPAGQPVRNAPLSILCPRLQPNQPWPFLTVNRLITDGEGNFRFSWGTFGPIQWLFLVPNVGYGAPDPVTVSPGQDVEGLTVALWEGVTLRVRLVDVATGQPLPGIQVQPQSAWNLYGGPLVQEAGYTDATGLFTLRGLMPGLYQVQVASPVTVGQPTASILLFPGQAEEPTLLPVAVNPEAAVLSGRIVGNDGQTPMANLFFSVYSQPGDQPAYYGFYQDQSAATATDSEGRYRLYWERPGPWRFIFRAAGVGYTLPKPVVLLAGKETPSIDLQLRPLASLTVVLRTEEGEPVAGGQVQVYPWDWSAFYLPLGNYRPWEPMATGADGTLHLADLVSGKYSLTASAPGRLARWQQVDLRAGAAATATLQLPAGLTVAGRIREAGRKDAVANAEVRWASSQGPPQPAWVPEAWRMDRTDAQGRFRLGPLALDQHYLWVYVAGRGYAWSDRFEAGPERTVEGLDLVLQPGGTLTGVVRDADTGQPVAEASVDFQWVFFADRSRSLGSVKANVAGRFTQTALLPGDYWVQVNPPGGGPVQRFPAVVRQGQTTSLEVALAVGQGEAIGGDRPAPAGERKVRVVGPDGATPLAGAEINPGHPNALLTDAEGQAMLKETGMGNRLTFKAEGFARQVVEVAFPEDGSPATVVLRWRGGTLAGRIVRGDTGQPVADATIWAVPWLDYRRSVSYSLFQQPAQRPPISSDFPQAAIDATGAFRLEQVMEDEYVLVAFAEGFLPTVREGMVVQEGATVEGLTLVLEDPQRRRLSGRIWGPGGQLLRETNLNVEAYQQQRPAWWYRAYSLKTDAEGCYSLQFPEAGNWTLRFRGTGGAEDWVAHLSNLQVSDDQPLEPQDISLHRPPSGTLAGRVLLPDGVTPAVGVKVAPFPLGRGEGWTGGFDFNRIAVTDAEGRFAWTDLPTATYGVCAPVSRFALGEAAAGWESAVVTGCPVEVGKAGPEVVLRYRPGGTLNVRVVDAATGEPLLQPRLRWDLWSAPAPPQPSERLVSEPRRRGRGLLCYEAWHPGLYEVYAWAEGYAGAREAVAVRPGEVTELTLPLAPLGYGALAGCVTLSDGQTPAALARIYLERLYTDDPRGQIPAWDYTYLPGVVPTQAAAITEADGRFVVPKCEAGRYQLVVRKAGYVPLVQEVQIVAGQTQELTLALPQGGVVAGRVLAADGQPAPGRRVVLTTQEKRIETFNPWYSYYWPLDLQQAITAADGTYRLEGVPAGQWWAFIFEGEVPQGVRSIAVPSGGVAAGIDFRLLPLTGEVAGTVRGTDGTPLQGVFLRLTPLDAPGGVVERYTDAGGKYRFEALMPGSWKLYVAAEGLANQVHEVQVGADVPCTVDFTLTPGGTLSGRLAAADGAPIAGAWITTAAPGRRWPAGAGLSLQGARSGADGTFTLPALAPGRYALSCSAPGYAPRTVEGEVKEGTVGEMEEIVLEGEREG